jgi:hypothetical protein
MYIEIGDDWYKKGDSHAVDSKSKRNQGNARRNVEDE